MSNHSLVFGIVDVVTMPISDYLIIMYNQLCISHFQFSQAMLTYLFINTLTNYGVAETYDNLF